MGPNLVNKLRGTNGVIGLLREISNKWERRAPLSPTDARILRELRGIKVVVQPSNLRIFSDDEYRAAGATISEDLSEANLILGVQRPDPDTLLPNRTYACFSRTIKAQPSGMPLLDSVLAKNIRLIDYECITENGERGGKRLVSFGSLCGSAGMINTFRGLGERFLSLGYSTPFLNISSSYMYPNLKVAHAAVEAMGKEISKNGLPSAISPLTFVFTGNGRASQGAQEMFRALPHEFVKPSELPELTRSWYSSHKNDSLRFKVYGCVVEEQDMVARRHDADERKKEHGDSTPVASSSWHNNVFDSKEYHFHPELYVPTFHERIAPYTNVLINATYWDRRYPRLLTFKQSEALLNEQRKQREAATASGKPGVHGLLAVSDISCDLDGSVQFLTRLSSIEKPFFVYDIFKRHAHEGVDGEGVLMMAINQLASEMPKEATRSFGSALLNFAADLANSDATQPLASSNLPVSLAGACITNQGQLTPTYSYIERMRRELERNRPKAPSVSFDPLDSVSTTILLQGHLFDTGLINKALDKVEVYNGSFDIRECLVRPNVSNKPKSLSSAVIVLEAPSRTSLDQLLDDLRQLVKDTPAAEATITELENFE